MADSEGAPVEKKFNRRRRKAVSAAVTDLEEGWEPKVFPKTEEESQRIRNVMDNNILFKFLDSDQRKIILDAMFRVDKKPEEVVIRQGDEGDNFYVIDSGVAEIFVNQRDGPPLHVLTCKDGDSFGELALMYDAPRAATVICKTEMKLWAMDRLTYKHILMDTTLKKRNMYKEFLEHVPLLRSLDPYERLKVLIFFFLNLLRPKKTFEIFLSPLTPLPSLPPHPFPPFPPFSLGGRPPRVENIRGRSDHYHRGRGWGIVLHR